MNNLILIGFKGSGKSTLGKAISLKYRKPFIDTDELFNEPAYLVYQRAGKKHFQEQESYHIQQLEHVRKSVIATGGGSICDENNRHVLQKLGVIIFLHTPQEVIWERLQNRPSSLEFLQDKGNREPFNKVYEERLSLYQKMAHYTVKTEQELWQVMDLEQFFG
ncbi:shikimate kinase [Rhabdochlamydiaceae symbiont of Dictyostelium giganteum]|uniref:shikimate kinase n=1 Tax=Rhabdochlamydiaceae symbiont of Dictyostelium giganteum TaxID=3342349 RepID=UPI00384A4B74